jgi:hypothetical protein
MTYMAKRNGKTLKSAEILESYDRMYKVNQQNKLLNKTNEEEDEGEAVRL